MIRCNEPRCCDCALPLNVIEPFTGGVCHRVRCPGCGAQLHARRYPGEWLVCTADEDKHQRTGTLPAVIVPPPRVSLAHRTLLLRVLRYLYPCEGVQPGESSL